TRWLASTGRPSASKPPPWNFTARSRSVERRHSRRKLRKSTPSGPADAGTGKYSRIRPTCLSESILVYQKSAPLANPPKLWYHVGGKRVEHTAAGRLGPL